MSSVRKLSTNDTLIHDAFTNKIYLLPDYEDDLSVHDDPIELASQLVSNGRGACFDAEQLDYLWHATKHISPLT